MAQSFSVRLSKEQTYRHLYALCQNDALFTINDYPDGWKDEDYERIVISDFHTLEAGERKAVIGTIRLLPLVDGTVVMFVNKDALWHREIPDSGTKLFAKYITRAKEHFEGLDLVNSTIRSTDDIGMDKNYSEKLQHRQNSSDQLLSSHHKFISSSRIKIRDYFQVNSQRDPMKKIFKVLLIISGATLFITALSIRIIPEWLTIPGGILILLGVAFNAVLNAGSKIKDWVELLFGKEEKKDSTPVIQSTYSEINQQGGTNIIAKKIEHLEVHTTPSPTNPQPNAMDLPSKKAMIKISVLEQTKDRSPHIVVVVTNEEKKIIYCRAKNHAIYDSSGNNIKRSISDYANHFSWSGGSEKGIKEIPAGLDATINLVRTNYLGNGIAFLFDENPHSYCKNEGVYQIDMEIVGTIKEDSATTEFVGKRIMIKIEYKKNENPDGYGQIINNSELRLLDFEIR